MSPRPTPWRSKLRDPFEEAVEAIEAAMREHKRAQERVKATLDRREGRGGGGTERGH